MRVGDAGVREKLIGVSVGGGGVGGLTTGFGRCGRWRWQLRCKCPYWPHWVVMKVGIQEQEQELRNQELNKFLNNYWSFTYYLIVFFSIEELFFSIKEYMSLIIT